MYFWTKIIHCFFYVNSLNSFYLKIKDRRIVYNLLKISNWVLEIDNNYNLQKSLRSYLLVCNIKQLYSRIQLLKECPHF